MSNADEAIHNDAVTKVIAVGEAVSDTNTHVRGPIVSPYDAI